MTTQTAVKNAKKAREKSNPSLDKKRLDNASKNHRSSKKNLKDTSQEQEVNTQVSEVLDAETIVLIPDVIETIDLSLISCSPFNPRKIEDEKALEELKNSVLKNGIIQPITLRPVEGGYEIVCGERRFKAAHLAGYTTIPAIVKNYTEEQALEVTFLENLQRKDITEIEEAASFKQLIELRKYKIEDLTAKFCKSEKYIRKRLQLCNLIEEAAKLLIDNLISLGNAFELSKYNHEIQKQVYWNHLEDDNDYHSWRTLRIQDFKRNIEKEYCQDLEQYSFDKAACTNCQFNTATFTLFKEEASQHCQNLECIQEKQITYLVQTVTEMVNLEPNIGICTNPYTDSYAEVIQILNSMGYEVQKVYPRSFPELPSSPKEEEYETEEEYEAAVEEFNNEMQEYDSQTSEIHQKIAEGIYQKMVYLNYGTPVYVYHILKSTDQNSFTANENPIEKLEKQDKRNQEIVVERTVDKVIKFIREEPLPDTDLSPRETELLYYTLFSGLRSESLEKMGIEDKYYLSDDKKLALVSTLTTEQKNIIARDFILSYLISYSSGANEKSELLIEFAKIHFPQQTIEIEAPFQEVYEKRKIGIENRLDNLKGLQLLEDQKAKENQNPKAVLLEEVNLSEDGNVNESVNIISIPEEDESDGIPVEDHDEQSDTVYIPASTEDTQSIEKDQELNSDNYKFENEDDKIELN